MYITQDLKIIQNRIFRIAIIVRDILEKNNIPYFITYGTLLGAVRHKGFIPWDRDFDLCLFDETYDEALDCLRKNLPQDMFVEYYDTEPLYFHGWAHIKDLNSEWIWKGEYQDSTYSHKGLSIDLFRTKKIPENQDKLYRATRCVEYLDRRKNHNLITEDEYKRRINEEQLIIEREKAIINENHEDNIPEIYSFEIFYNDSLHVEDMLPLKKYIFENEFFYGPNKADVLLTKCYGDYMTPPPVDQRYRHNLKDSIKIYEKNDEEYRSEK